jgi:hypothetical protein
MYMYYGVLSFSGNQKSKEGRNMKDGFLPILGGDVPPECVVGRDELIEKMWRILERDSIVLVSERRTGKTTVMKKMEKEPQKGWYPIFLVLEGVRSPKEFIRRNYDAIAPILSKRNRALSCLKAFWDRFAGAKIGDWHIPGLENYWKELLAAILRDIAENFEERVVFLWDEIPLMISNISKDHGPTVAMELLDVLRDHRVADKSGKIRMVYTGSIGLHLVLSELRQARYMNEPTNDMYKAPLEALSNKHARELASRLLAGSVEKKGTAIAGKAEELAKRIATVTDGLPFYINHVVFLLSELERPVTVKDVDDAMDSLIFDPEDKAEFSHYSERIKVYYVFDPMARDLAYAILDVVCRSAAPIKETSIWDAVVAQIELTKRDLFRETLDMLERDHYLVRSEVEGERAYRFKYGIIRRWWQKKRG